MIVLLGSLTVNGAAKVKAEDNPTHTATISGVSYGITLGVWSEASNKSTRLTTLKNGDMVMLYSIEKVNGFYKVRFGDIMGYTNANYIIDIKDIPTVTRDADGYIMITKSDDFKAMSGIYANENFRIMNDIVMADNYETVGAYSSPFSGILDGNNKTIQNLRVPLLKYVGAATFNNLTVKDMNMNLSGDNGVYSVAAISSAFDSTANYTNCHVKGGSINYSYTNTSYDAESANIAGMAVSGGTFTNCTSSVNVTVNTTNITDTSVSGLIGYASKVEGCNNSGNVSVTCCSSGNLAGVVNHAGNVISCSNTGKIIPNGAFSMISGIAGEATTEIVSCKNKGVITGKLTNGNFTTETTLGGVAANGKAKKCVNSGKIDLKATGITKLNAGGVCGITAAPKACKNLAAISISFEPRKKFNSASSIGGVFGDSAGTTQYCYNSGKIILKSVTGDVGGVTGYGYTVQNCYNGGSISVTGEKHMEGNIGGIVGNTSTPNKLFAGNYNSATVKLLKNGRVGSLIGYGNTPYTQTIKMGKNYYVSGKRVMGRGKMFDDMTTNAKRLSKNAMKKASTKLIKKIDKKII